MATQETGQAFVLDVKDFDMKTIDEAEKKVKKAFSPSEWKYRLFYEWDPETFDGVGNLRLLAISSSTIKAEKVKDILNNMGKKWADCAREPGQDKLIGEFLIQELGILEGMAIEAKSPARGELTSDVVEKTWGKVKPIYPRRQPTREWPSL